MKLTTQRTSLSELPPWVSAAAVAGTFALLAWAESRRPLRTRRREPVIRRDLRNAGVAALALAAMQVAERPITSRLTRFVRTRRMGLVPQFGLPAWLANLLSCVALDYTLYLWHVLTHKVPVLWRFHRVHHADLDMDASTGVRFHFGEILISAGWRAAQVAAIGVSERALSIWNTLLLMEVMFHHSNVRLPPAIERRLGWILVTPRMHGIHHSIRRDELNSNWSSGLFVWDWLHGTLRADVPQERIEIGLADLRRVKDITLPRLLVMPFEDAAGHELPSPGAPIGERYE